MCPRLYLFFFLLSLKIIMEPQHLRVFGLFYKGMVGRAVVRKHHCIPATQKQNELSLTIPDSPRCLTLLEMPLEVTAIRNHPHLWKALFLPPILLFPCCSLRPLLASLFTSTYCEEQIISFPFAMAKMKSVKLPVFHKALLQEQPTLPSPQCWPLSQQQPVYSRAAQERHSPQLSFSVAQLLFSTSPSRCLPNPRHLLDLPLVLSAFLVLIPIPSCISLGAAKAHSWYPLSPLCSFAALQEGLPSSAKGSFQTHGDCTTHTHAHTYTTNSTLTKTQDNKKHGNNNKKKSPVWQSVPGAKQRYSTPHIFSVNCCSGHFCFIRWGRTLETQLICVSCQWLFVFFQLFFPLFFPWPYNHFFVLFGKLATQSITSLS